MLTTALLEKIQQVQQSWIGTAYSGHVKKKHEGAGCYSLISCILDEFYKKQKQSPLPLTNPCVGVCKSSGYKIVLYFRRNFPLWELKKTDIDLVEPGDLVICRSVPGLGGPDWMGHMMMAGVKKGQVIHTLPDINACWGSLHRNLGRIVRIYRPLHKENWV